MKQRTLQLFQLFLVIFAVYALLKYSGNERLLVSLACLVTAFLVGKVETRLTEHEEGERKQRHDVRKVGEAKTTSQALEWLLKSKNVLLLTDAIQCLLQDLGLIVSPSANNRAVDRVVRIPGMEVLWGLIIMGDVEDLHEGWDKWEDIAAFEKERQGKQRVLIICSNAVKAPGGGKQEYQQFSSDVQERLTARQMVAMTTLTFCKMYLVCKKKGVDIKKIFHLIEDHPGGVFRLERLSR